VELLLDMTAKVTSREALAGVFLGLDILRKHCSVNDAMPRNSLESAFKTAEERSVQLERKSSSV